MTSRGVTTSVVVGLITVFFGLFYQFILKDIIYITVGVGRTIDRIESFPFNCRKVQHKLLQSCEDLWLDEDGRRLYAACSDLVGRQGWSPGGSLYNASARRLMDHVSVLNIDEPGEDGLYGLHQLEVPETYKSASGGKDLDLHGFGVEVLSHSKLRFRMINHRPPVDSATGEGLDGPKYGANSTVEVFDLTRGSSKWEFVMTIADPAIVSPNNLAPTTDGGFLITNDHSAKVGYRRNLDMFLSGATITYCSPNNACHTASSENHFFPNGIVRGQDGFYYIADSAKGKITIHCLSKADHKLAKIDEIKLGIPIDNLSIDSEGAIFAAAISDALTLIKALDDPFNINPAATVLRIRKLAEGQVLSGYTYGNGKSYQVTKILEDAEGKILPFATTGVHDVQSGQVWLGGILAGWIAVCEAELPHVG